MADATALVSVIASAVVSVSAIVASALVARADRKQARDLAARAEAAAERATVRESLADLAVWVVRARLVLRYPSFDAFTGHELLREEHLDALILRYAPSRVRKALAAFDEAWALEGHDVVHAYASAAPHRKAKEDYIDANDFEEAARARAAERDFIQPVWPTLEKLRVALGEVEDALSAALAPRADA